MSTNPSTREGTYRAIFPVCIGLTRVNRSFAAEPTTTIRINGRIPPCYCCGRNLPRRRGSLYWFVRLALRLLLSAHACPQFLWAKTRAASRLHLRPVCDR